MVEQKEFSLRTDYGVASDAKQGHATLSFKTIHAAAHEGIREMLKHVLHRVGFTDDDRPVAAGGQYQGSTTKDSFRRDGFDQNFRNCQVN